MGTLAASALKSRKPMTEKQIERIKLKIDKYKKALSNDKKMWGGEYHDGHGIRYVLTAEYIKIKDYKSGLKFLKWFDKNFPGDRGYPIFLFEATIILFKCDKLKEAEIKAHRTFFSNTYLFDKFLGKEMLLLDKDESSNWESESLLDDFPYSKTNEEFADFSIWIESILNSRLFLDKANEFIEIQRKLKTEPVGQTRTKLVNRLSKLHMGES
jgi:hypothetical protein